MAWVTRASDDARVGMMPRGRVASFLGRAGRQQLTVASRAPGTIRMGKQGNACRPFGPSGTAIHGERGCPAGDREDGVHIACLASARRANDRRPRK